MTDKIEISRVLGEEIFLILMEYRQLLGHAYIQTKTPFISLDKISKILSRADMLDMVTLKKITDFREAVGIKVLLNTDILEKEIGEENG